MDFQFKPISIEKDHVGVVFCDSKNRLIGHGKKLDQISKKLFHQLLIMIFLFKKENQNHSTML